MRTRHGQHTPKILLRIEEAADALGIGRSTLYELIGQGEIATVRIGRSVRISMSALEEWAERQSIPRTGHGVQTLR